jgi:hypothetical protein
MTREIVVVAVLDVVLGTALFTATIYVASLCVPVSG